MPIICTSFRNGQLGLDPTFPPLTHEPRSYYLLPKKNSHVCKIGGTPLSHAIALPVAHSKGWHRPLNPRRGKQGSSTMFSTELQWQMHSAVLALRAVRPEYPWWQRMTEQAPECDQWQGWAGRRKGKKLRDKPKTFSIM